VQIEQVLLNLLLNACEAMSANTRGQRELTIGTQATADGEVQISVADRGPGIPADEEPRLFEPFFTTKPQGLGLGLSISRSIITAHGGHLWGGNNDGPGATFYIVLPGQSGASA
jgi:two-component system, LuxR family, sensor kinase FixL